jgi:hypothetical protein
MLRKVPFKSLDEVLALPEFHDAMPFRPELDSSVVSLQRLLSIGRNLITSEGDEVRINKKRFVLSGGELVQKPSIRR